MKLYYSPGACSLSPHIVLRELGLPFNLVRVDLKTKVTETGADFRAINPKGYVPALEIKSGVVLTEGPAVIQYLADQNPKSNLAPAAGTIERARLQEHLNVISAELHKAFGPLFHADASAAEKAGAPAAIGRQLDVFEAALADGRPYLLGQDYSIADPYLFVIGGWVKPTGIGYDKWPKLGEHWSRIAKRDAVRAALRAEGLA
ncbi:MAG: glutathione transferase GstA [Alphaproteobacteria bacterium]|nr:glutathione transferase GstA [Alphaproteobacteria bacterium]